MERLTLHRTLVNGWYQLGNTNLILIKEDDGRWHIDAVAGALKWYDQHPELRSTSFSTRREAMDYLEALLAHDPLPGPRRKLPRPRRTEDGSYRFGRWTIRRHSDGRRWAIFNCDGVESAVAVSLHDACSYLAFDLINVR